MEVLLDLTRLGVAEKDAPIGELWARVSRADGDTHVDVAPMTAALWSQVSWVTRPS
jgi:hypothetical protein